MFRKKKTSVEGIRKRTWRQFKKNKLALLSLYLLIFLGIVGFLAPFIANDQPLYVKYKGETFYPAFTTYFNPTQTDSVQDPETQQWEKIQYDITDWKKMDLEEVTWPLITWSPSKTDRYNRGYKSPGGEQFTMNSNGEKVAIDSRHRHILGTDKIGRDVMSGLIHGTRISLLIGIISMGIAGVIGIVLGSISGYFGNDKIELSRGALLLMVFGLIPAYFYGFYLQRFGLTDAFQSGAFYGLLKLLWCLIVFIGIVGLFGWIGNKWRKGFLGEKVNLPLDGIISRVTELFVSLPRLLIIITIAAVVQQKSIALLMVIIGLTSWAQIARYTRAEMLKVKQLGYIESARALGIGEFKLIFKHALPNALAPVMVTLAFGVASAILIESGLSFLNIGVPEGTVTWGSILSSGRAHPTAYWLILYPGLAIFTLVAIYNLIGEGLRNALDPKKHKL